jgi:hypothetical protein
LLQQAVIEQVKNGLIRKKLWNEIKSSPNFEKIKESVPSLGNEQFRYYDAIEKTSKIPLEQLNRAEFEKLASKGEVAPSDQGGGIPELELRKVAEGKKSVAGMPIDADMISMGEQMGLKHIKVSADDVVFYKDAKGKLIAEQIMDIIEKRESKQISNAKASIELGKLFGYADADIAAFLVHWANMITKTKGFKADGYALLREAYGLPVEVIIESVKNPTTGVEITFESGNTPAISEPKIDILKQASEVATKQFEKPVPAEKGTIKKTQDYWKEHDVLKEAEKLLPKTEQKLPEPPKGPSVKGGGTATAVKEKVETKVEIKTEPAIKEEVKPEVKVEEKTKEVVKEEIKPKEVTKEEIKSADPLTDIKEKIKSDDIEVIREAIKEAESGMDKYPSGSDSYNKYRDVYTKLQDKLSELKEKQPLGESKPKKEVKPEEPVKEEPGKAAVKEKELTKEAEKVLEEDRAYNPTIDFWDRQKGDKTSRRLSDFDSATVDTIRKALADLGIRINDNTTIEVTINPDGSVDISGYVSDSAILAKLKADSSIKVKGNTITAPLTTLISKTDPGYAEKIASTSPRLVPEEIGSPIGMAIPAPVPVEAPLPVIAPKPIPIPAPRPTPEPIPAKIPGVTEFPVPVPKPQPVPVPEPKPVPVPPKKPPPGKTIIILPPPSRKLENLTDEEKKGIIAWKQGFIYWNWIPPYGKTNLIPTRKPVEMVSYYKGPGSAYASAMARGITPPELKRDFGVFDISLKIPPQKVAGEKRKVTIRYKRDPQHVYTGMKRI